MTTLASLGKVLEMTEDVIYALPARLCNFTVFPVDGTFEVSNDASTWAAITPDSNGNFVSSAAFIRVTDDDALLCAKPY